MKLPRWLSVNCFILSSNMHFTFSCIINRTLHGSTCRGCCESGLRLFFPSCWLLSSYLQSWTIWIDCDHRAPARESHRLLPRAWIQIGKSAKKNRIEQLSKRSKLSCLRAAVKVTYYFTNATSASASLILLRRPPSPPVGSCCVLWKWRNGGGRLALLLLWLWKEFAAYGSPLAVSTLVLFTLPRAGCS